MQWIRNLIHPLNTRSRWHADTDDNHMPAYIKYCTLWWRSCDFSLECIYGFHVFSRFAVLNSENYLNWQNNQDLWSVSTVLRLFESYWMQNTIHYIAISDCSEILIKGERTQVVWHCMYVTLFVNAVYSQKWDVIGGISMHEVDIVYATCNLCCLKLKIAAQPYLSWSRMLVDMGSAPCASCEGGGRRLLKLNFATDYQNSTS